jgi:CRISPR-associated protein Cst2
LLYTFLELNGAMRSTQLPHLVALEGVLTTSSSTIPAPLISPLIGDNEDSPKVPLYRTQLAEIVSALNGGGDSIDMKTFNTIGEFASGMRAAIDTIAPLRLAVGR